MAQRPAFNTTNLSPAIAALMATAAGRKWLVVLPDDATSADGAPVGCHTFYMPTAAEAQALADRHAGAAIFEPESAA